MVKGHSLLQSEAWQKLQTAIGEETFFESKKDYQFLAIKKSVPGGSYLYVPYGPYFESKEGAKSAREALEALAESQGAYFIRIEPQDAESASEWLKSCIKSKDLNPAETWRLDLTASEDEILKNFSHTNRNLYRNYMKKGVEIKTSKNSDDLDAIINMQKELAKIKKVDTFSKDYLTAELEQPFAILYTAVYHLADDKGESKREKPQDGTTLAASLFFDYDGVRYYMQSAADERFKYYPATPALLSTAIFDAKTKGLKYFDFWGIAPEGASHDHPWYGFTEFKKSFGGFEVKYAGTYDYVLDQKKYKKYQLLRKINRIKRKIFNR